MVSQLQQYSSSNRFDRRFERNTRAHVFTHALFLPSLLRLDHASLLLLM